MRFIILFFLTVLSSRIFSQRIEAGFRLFQTLNQFEIGDGTPGNDSLSQGATWTEKKRPSGRLSSFIKFYPKSNSLFFSADVFTTSTTALTYYEFPSHTGFQTKTLIKKQNFRALIGFDFSRQKKVTFFGVSGLLLTAVKVKSSFQGISVEGNLNGLVGDRFAGIKKNNIALCLGGGVKRKRFSLDFMLAIDPFTGNKGVLRKTLLTSQIGLGYVFLQRNLVKSQFEERKIRAYELNKSSSPSVVISVFTEARLFAGINKFQYADTFLFPSRQYGTVELNPDGGYMEINIKTPPNVDSKFSLGTSYKIKLKNTFYAKVLISGNVTEMTFYDFGKGSTVVLHNNELKFEVIDGSNYLMKTRLDHGNLSCALGYSNLTRNAFFAEAGFEINYWNVARNVITTRPGANGRAFVGYYSFREKMNFRKYFFGGNLTVGYKVNNIVAYVNISNSFQNQAKQSLFGFAGKYGEAKIGVAYQLFKLYSKIKRP
jgi:hypothetical protein